jgi:hypothetical protein
MRARSAGREHRTGVDAPVRASVERVRTSIGAAAAVALIALLGGCAGGGSDGSDGSDGGESSADSASPAPESSAPSSPDVPVVDSAACEEVRNGIDAFNRGEYDETVERFEEALLLAQSQDDGSARAGRLVEAVRYYAELDADEYLEAARSSPDFAKYKAITLGQCASGDGEAPESPGVEV